MSKPETSRLSGTVETDEVRVASRFGGRVTALGAREGEEVEAGRVIVELEAPELQAREAQAVAWLAELEAGPRAEERAAARADWQAQLAELEYARSERQRILDLFRERTVSEADRDRAETRVRALELTAAAAESRHALLEAGTRPERIAQARAQLAEIRTQLAELRVVAPSRCVLETLAVRVGDVVGPNREVAVLLLADRLWVRVYAPQPWLGRLRLDQRARVVADAFPDRRFEGRIEQIGRQAEFTPRNVQTVEERVKQVFPVRVRLPAEGGVLRAGMSVEVEFEGIGVQP